MIALPTNVKEFKLYFLNTCVHLYELYLAVIIKSNQDVMNMDLANICVVSLTEERVTEVACHIQVGKLL